MIEIALDAVVTMGGDGAISAWNGEACRAKGSTRKGLVGGSSTWCVSDGSDSPLLVSPIYAEYPLLNMGLIHL
jgi:hypothetical protein